VDGTVIAIASTLMGLQQVFLPMHFSAFPSSPEGALLVFIMIGMGGGGGIRNFKVF
jgi:hypothetical protein